MWCLNFLEISCVIFAIFWVGRNKILIMKSSSLLNFFCETATKICCLSCAVIEMHQLPSKYFPVVFMTSFHLQFFQTRFLLAPPVVSTTHESPASSQSAQRGAWKRRTEIWLELRPAAEQVGGNTWGVNYNHHNPQCTFAINTWKRTPLKVHFLLPTQNSTDLCCFF